MDMKLVLIAIFTLLGSILSVGLAGIFLLTGKKWLNRLSGVLISYSIGTLLGAAFFGMIPHALQRCGPERILPTILFGILLFFILEKAALWRHCHEQPCQVHSRAGFLILLGDSLHNFVDGTAIAAAFIESVPLGIATAMAVIAHEVPQEIGDFAILMESGYSRVRAFLGNTLSSMAALPGALLTYALRPWVQPLVPYLLAISSASFLYIALADLIPGRRAVGGRHSLFWEIPLTAMGILTILLVRHPGK